MGEHLPYTLMELLGRGGMAEVYRGRSEAGVLAVKLLHGERVLQEGARAAFRDEVRLASGLRHPHVVRIVDAGEQEDNAPWLAMELCEGTLAGCGNRPWTWQRTVLLQLLDGLAHAHARGVVHRDLKPANVLLLDGRWLLSDFGIGLAIGDSQDPGSCGTPSYMAPEQAQGAWREQGPWTDLYALGCLSWKLATGRTPFRGTGVKVLVDHITRPLPRLPARLGAPDGLEQWLQGLLSKHPSRRYRRAADAAFALISVSDSGWMPEGLIGSEDALPATATTAVLLSKAAADSSPRPVVGGGPRPPPFAERWDLEIPYAPPATREGLGLWGLREGPLVGRRQERQVLWSHLQAVHAGRGPRLVVIEGPPGCGKSSLARWLTTRAHELGAVRVITGASDLRELFESALHAAGLKGDALAEILPSLVKEVAMVDGVGLPAIRAWLDPSGSQALPSERHRLGVISRFIVGLARSRPVVVWLDGAVPGSQALCRALLDASAPILLLRSAQEGPDEVAAHRMSLEPLSRAEQCTLVASLLPLDQASVVRVAERAGGSPGFARQLLGHWVDNGLLRETPDGFVPTALDDAPSAFTDLWTSRLWSLGALHPSLELAALLGHQINSSTWTRACAVAGVVPAWDEVERLAARGLVAGDRLRERWRFAEAAVREILRLRARSGGSIAALHLACAEALRGADPAAEGRHWRAGERPLQALPALFAATDIARVASNLPEAERLIAELEAAASEAGLPPGDERWGRIAHLRLQLVYRATRLEEAQSLAKELLRRSVHHGWAHLHAVSLLTLAGLAQHQGRVEDAWRVLESAREVALVSAPDLIGRIELVGAHLHLLQGEAEQGEARARLALERPTASALDHYHRGSCYSALAWVERRRGNLAEVEAHTAAAEECFERAGSLTGLAMCSNLLATVALSRGDSAAEEKHLRQGVARDPENPLSALNLGLLLARRLQWSEAHPLLLDVIRRYEATGELTFVAGALLALCARHAAHQDWEGWDRDFVRAREILDACPYLDPDHVLGASAAAEQAVLVGDSDRATAARALEEALRLRLETRA